jgi:hypothetical protein
MSDSVIIVLITCITVVVITLIVLIGELVSGRNEFRKEILRYQSELDVIEAKKDMEMEWVERKDV